MEPKPAFLPTDELKSYNLPTHGIIIGWKSVGLSRRVRQCDLIPVSPPQTACPFT